MTQNARCNKTPQKDASGPQREHQWSYCTIIGMLTYLSMSSHPDIAFRCTSFCSL
jgi:hypothetical protein